jgi:hypothetical protein
MKLITNLVIVISLYTLIIRMYMEIPSRSDNLVSVIECMNYCNYPKVFPPRINILRIIKRRIRFINGKTVTHSPIYATPYERTHVKR